VRGKNKLQVRMRYSGDKHFTDRNVPMLKGKRRGQCGGLMHDLTNHTVCLRLKIGVLVERSGSRQAEERRQNRQCRKALETFHGG
jgi:hypothetical protein